MEHKIVQQHIWECFCELLETTPFEKLTVERLAAHSGVAKATFYRHFRDKYDVMNFNSATLAGRLTGGRCCQDWKEFFLYMFREILKDREYYRKVFRTSGQNAHSHFLYEYCFSFVKSRYLAANHREELNETEQYQIRHYCHGSVGTLEDWIQDPHPMGAEKMAVLYYEAMPEQIRTAWQPDPHAAK